MKQKKKLQQAPNVSPPPPPPATVSSLSTDEREKRDATTSKTGYNERESSSKTADEDHPKPSEEKQVTSKRKELLEPLSGNAASSGMAGRLRRASDIAKKIRRSSGTNIDQTSSQTSQSVAPKPA